LSYHVICAVPLSLHGTCRTSQMPAIRYGLVQFDTPLVSLLAPNIPSLCHYNIALPVMRTYSGSETSKSWSTSLIVLSCCSNAGISSSIYNMTTKCSSTSQCSQLKVPLQFCTYSTHQMFTMFCNMFYAL
jgi:hypothetical protein